MKKLISLLLAMAMVLSLGVMAFAGNFKDDDNSLDVSYSTSEAYVVTIPADVAVSAETQKGKVSASGVLLADGKELVVSMKSANGYKLAYAGSEIVYTVVAGKTTFSGTNPESVLVIESGSVTGETELSFATTAVNIAAATKAGAHTDTLTFSCAVQDIPKA